MKQHRPIKPANWIPAILLFLSIFLLLLAQNLPAFAEWYATGPYRAFPLGKPSYLSGLLFRGRNAGSYRVSIHNRLCGFLCMGLPQET